MYMAIEWNYLKNPSMGDNTYPTSMQ
jgi:hypothetical protein